MSTPFEELMWLFSSSPASRGIVRLNLAEAALLYKYAKKKKEGRLLEIGRKHGGSAVLMASALTLGKVYSIDIRNYPEVKENIVGLEHKIHILTGDSRKVEWSMPIDLLFLDGNHSYEYVTSDVKKYVPLIRPDGYFIMHDVVGVKPELKPIIKKLKKGQFEEVDRADTMLVLQKTGE